MSDNIQQEKLFSAKETVALLGISRPTLSRLQQKGAIGCYKIGVRTLFAQKHIEDFLTRHERVPKRTRRANVVDSK
jgi:excisionase family DNA binding protein